MLEYFDLLIENECIKNADLHGILLTGLSSKCVDMFQSFIDKTDDIQTVCLAIIHSPYNETVQSKQVQYWINSYRDLLNKFKFWEKRFFLSVFLIFHFVSYFFSILLNSKSHVRCISY